MIGLDTNVLVRYFTGDDPRQSVIAARWIERQLAAPGSAHVSLVTMAELAWVLRRSLGADKDLVIEIVMHLLADERFVIQEHDAVWVALDVYKSSNVDFSDALIAALDRLQGCTRTITFDRRAARIEGVHLLS